MPQQSNKAMTGRNDEEYKLLIESIPHMVWMTEPNGSTIYRSPLTTRHLGLPAESFHGWEWLNLLHPDDVVQARQLWESCIRSETSYRNEYRVRLADGTYRWYLAQALPMRGADGSVERWIGTWTDIDDLKQAEAQVHLRDRALQAINQGILITDPTLPDNPIVFASPGFEQLTGYQEADVLGRNGRFLHGKDTDQATLDRVREAIAAEQPCTVCLLNYKKDGTPFWNELSISPVRNDQGQLTHFVGVQADVTQRRQLEELVRQAQKMEAIGQLAGGMAHDFNNLLTIITGYSELLLESLSPDDPAREPLEEIHKAGKRSTSLTRQLLAFSRKQVLTPRILNLNAVVHNTEQMLHRLSVEDVRLATVLHPWLDYIRADPGQIEQILLNLVVNARDAMPQGGSLTIETQNVELDAAYAIRHPGIRAGAYVMLAVTDTGTGMGEEIKRHIFEPFFTTKSPDKGTGLGLAVVYGIVQQSGGHIEVDSESGVGTSVKIYLPSAAQPALSGQPRPGLVSAPLGTETILLVEDEEAVRTLSLHVLRSCGYTVLEAGDGDEAQRIGTQHQGPIHLLATDVVMPGLSARALAEQLLTLYPEMKVLYLSGYPDDEVVRHGIMHEQVNFLQKPYSPHALAHKVREVLTKEATR